MRRPALLAAACSIAVAVVGCGSGATTNCKVPPDRELLLAIRAHAGPIVLTTAERRGNAGRLTITACQTSDSEATATLTVFSLSEKSTRDIRHGMKLERKAGKWTVMGDSHSRRCQGATAAEEFSSARCPRRGDDAS
jgi:hypothetical protein